MRPQKLTSNVQSHSNQKDFKQIREDSFKTPSTRTKKHESNIQKISLGHVIPRWKSKNKIVLQPQF